MPWIECVANVSEGRRRDVIDRIAGSIESAGALLLDVSFDPAHHRSVFTFADDRGALLAAVFGLFDTALAAIDLRDHHGEHPRIGAVDVVPFVPLDGATMDACVALSRTVGAAVAAKYDLPIYLYERAAAVAGRERLEHIRRGGFEGLADKMRQPEWKPDFGPSRPHSTAGASVIGARPPLIAYNVTLATTRLDVAKAIAQSIRERSGGLPAVKAMAVDLADRGIVQVSMNLTDFDRTSIVQAFDAITREAARHGVDVGESELVGLAPLAALSPAMAAHVRLTDFTADRILETRLERLARTRPRTEH